MTAVEGTASVCQVHPVTRITDEWRAWGPEFKQEGAGRGWGGEETGRANQSVRKNYKSLRGINLTVVERMHQLIM